jgi:uncharacterized membrane protein
MNYQAYRYWRSGTAVFVAAAAAVSVLLGIVYILLAAVITGIIVLVAVRRRVTEVISDERTYAIAYKAARLTMALIGVGMAIVGAVLLALARQDFTSTLAQVGFALEYSVCVLLIVYKIAYTYYSRKFGGAD